MQQATNSVRHRSAMQEHSIWSQVKFGIYWVQGYCALTFINLLPCLTSVFKFYLNYWVGVKERSGAQHSHKRPFPSCCYLCFKTGVGTQVSFHVEMRLIARSLSGKSNSFQYEMSCTRNKKQLRNGFLKIFCSSCYRLQLGQLDALVHRMFSWLLWRQPV